MSPASQRIANSIAAGKEAVGVDVAALIGQSLESRLQDILTDLAHWADSEDIDFMEAVHAANRQANSERAFR